LQNRLNCKTAESQNRKIAKSQNCKTAKPQNRKTAKLQNCKTAKLPNRQIAKTAKTAKLLCCEFLVY